MTQTVGSFLFETLYNRGVKHAFGIPGDFALPTVKWIDKSPIEFLTMTHEPSVGFAADCYARVNGLGVALVTYCVGGLNMLNSVACAYAEKSPIIVISGGPSPKDRRNDHLIHHKVRTFDTQRKIFEEVTCANTVLDDPETAAAEILRVIDTVQRQCRPGYIEVPYDVVDMPLTRISNSRPLEWKDSDPECLDACIEEAAAFINKAERPVLLAGVELHRHGLTDHIMRIAEKFNIPVAADLLSKSVVSETHPLYIGVYSGGLSEPECQEYIDKSDCVIMLGTFITDFFLGMYTSGLLRRNSILVTTEKASVGYHSYDDIRLEDFLNRLEKAPIKERPDFTNPMPTYELRPLKAEEHENPILVDDFFRVLETHLAEGDTIVSDTGDALFGAMRLRTSKRRNFLADAYYLSMGFAVPGAIGAMANSHSQMGRTYALVGDGAFQMTGIELSTAAKYKMAPIVIILNNDGYGTQRFILDGTFNNIHMWDYTKITELLGYGTSMRVSTLGELDNALKDAVKHPKRLSLIEVIVPKDSCSPALRSVGEGLAKLRNSKQ